MKLIILDRDGVINIDSPSFVKSAAEWTPIAGSIEGISLLKAAGWKVAIASNQSGLGRGLFSEEDLEGIHRKMFNALKAYGAEIDLIEVCPHAPDFGCGCRKPKPGLLEKIGARFECSLVNVPVVGDSKRDLDAAATVQAKPILVLTGNGRATSDMTLPVGTLIFNDLLEVSLAFT